MRRPRGVAEPVRQRVRLTVIDWNLDAATPLGGKLELLARCDWDVLLLQEVTDESWPAVRGLGTAVWSAGRIPRLASPPRLHSAVVVRDGWRLTDTGPIAEVPSPERTATALVGRGGLRCAVASLGLPPASSWGTAGKGRQADRLACWLREQTLPTIVGIDAYAPKRDRPRLAECEWWDEGEALLLGADRIHDLRDAYRDVLRRDPGRRADVLDRWPDGPLATSYVSGDGRGASPCRYDHVLVSPDFEVDDVRHLYDEALAAGSDHALVLAELRVR
jgi:hypothetical protein